MKFSLGTLLFYSYFVFQRYHLINYLSTRYHPGVFLRLTCITTIFIGTARNSFVVTLKIELGRICRALWGGLCVPKDVGGQNQ
jgi:hypothetical protein